MITIKIWGGLGNQLFQYAFGYSLCKKSDQEMSLDFSFFDNQPVNTGKRNIGIDELNICEYKVFVPFFAVNLLNNKYIGAITRNLPPTYWNIGRGYMYFKEPIHKYVENIKVYPNTYFDGYWQTSKYFSSCRTEIVNMFTPKEGLTENMRSLCNEMSFNNSVSVHIRKGDFGNGKFRKVGHTLPIEYYQRAIDIFNKKIESPKFYFFSDDSEWVKEQFGEKDNFFFASELGTKSAVDDLIAMSSCKHGIMSASTFSWWGNWLRRDNEGMVIVPNGKYYNEYFYEPHWVKI